MASLVLLLSEFLHPLNTQIVYTYSSNAAAAAATSTLQKNNSKSDAEDVKRVESIRQKQVKEAVLSVEDDDNLPCLKIDSELVWP